MSKEEKRVDKLEIKRHSLSHILAAAVLEMFPEAKFGFGPAVENGFYYDFELPRTLIPEDLPIIEEKMREIIKKNNAFEKKNIPIEEAKSHFQQLRQTYKLELLDDLKKEGYKNATIYKIGSFVDLCSGPHLESAGEINADSFKLTKLSGAYWKGDENNIMLQRIYGVAFNDKKSLKKYLKKIEEAAKRDHRKIGKEMDLFVFSDLVGSGLPLFTPKGTIIKEELQKYIESICRRYDFEKVITPHLANIKLFKTSGHADKFSDELFHVTSKNKQNFVIKPVQCPHQTQIYASRLRSYKDLPIRYMESEKQYRAEKPGEIGGLNRVIAITVEDGHSFCALDQVKQEIKNLVDNVKEFYGTFGLWGNQKVSLSVRDYQNPNKYIGDKKDWDKCENMLKEISDELGLNAEKQEGEAALYGPKIDFMFKDALGKEIQIPTIQLDFATPKRFGLTYIDKKGEKVNPVMIHRAILGSYERFMALLIEHYAGKFPVWIAPVQATILPVSEKFNEYAEKVKQQLKEQDIRVELDLSDESLSKKIAGATSQKVPYMLIVGEKEEEGDLVAVRHREGKKQEVMKVEEFLEKLLEEIKKKK
jgi:threonyl-tRNA synthetase